MSSPDATEAWVDTILAAVESSVLASGWFERVNTHEPKNLPGHGLTCAIWVQDIEAAQGVSGLASSCALLTFNVRGYSNMLQEPADQIDPRLTKAISALMRTWHGNFDFDLHPMVRNVDLLGELGTPLRARAGYVDLSNKPMRVMTITLPIIVNDVWPQVA